jgi:hypothetical protein
MQACIHPGSACLPEAAGEVPVGAAAAGAAAVNVKLPAHARPLHHCAAAEPQAQAHAGGVLGWAVWRRAFWPIRDGGSSVPAASRRSAPDLKTASAEGLRQMLPRQTKSTRVLPPPPPAWGPAPAAADAMVQPRCCRRCCCCALCTHCWLWRAGDGRLGADARARRVAGLAPAASGGAWLHVLADASMNVNDELCCLL